jgi:hypothetical protein
LNEIHSTTLFQQILRKSSSNRIEFDLHLNKSMENEKLHNSIGPHYSPRPQWLTGPKPSLNSPNPGLWLVHAVGCAPSAWLARGHRAVSAQHRVVLAGVSVAYR